MDLKRFISICLVSIMSVPFLTACSSKDELITLEDSKNVQAADLNKNSTDYEKTVTIAYADWAPYEFKKDGEIRGITVDIVDEVFKRMGYKVTKKMYPFSRAIEMLKNGEIDMIADVKNTLEHQEIGIFNKEPLVTTTTSLFIRNDANIVFNGNIDNLKQYKVGTIRDYYYGEEFKEAVKNKLINIEEVDDKIQNINKLIDNRVDICIENSLVMKWALASTNNIEKIEEVKPELNSTPIYGWFTKKKNLGPMLEEFDRKLIEIKADGTYERIYKSYVN